MTATAIMAPPVSGGRTSHLLRNVLLSNPNVEVFTVEQILESMGPDKPEASLVLFSMPSMVPVPDLPAMSGASAGIIAGQMTVGRKTIQLPKVVMRQKVPRRSLAVAIHALVPVIEAAEKLAKPRLKWVCSPIVRRMLGMLLFVLAVAIAFPVIGFDPLHAASISVISLGLAEQDGLAILLGAMAGLISLALIVTSGITAKILKSNVVKWLRKLARRAGKNALAAMCERRGWTWLAAVLRFQWADMLLGWDPEKRADEKHARAQTARAEATTTRRQRPPTRKTKPSSLATGAKRARQPQPLTA